MRTFIFFLFALVFAGTIFAQIPQSLNYQAVARNNQGVAVSNQTIQVRFTIVRGPNTLYTETRQITTNMLGLFNVQIGSPGALASSGDFESIHWANNTPPIMLKVELDLANNNVFTDMGTQPFSTVPTAFWAGKAIEVHNLAGRYIDQLAVPTPGSKLTWDGNAWLPVRKDTTIFIQVGINNIPVQPGNPLVWVGVVNGQYVGTFDGTETISASFTAAIGHGNSVSIPVTTGVCYQDINGGDLTLANDASLEHIIPHNNGALSIIVVPAVGLIRNLSPGTYRIGMCIRNKAVSSTLEHSDRVHGVIEIKY